MSAVDVSLVAVVVLAAGGYLAWVLFSQRDSASASPAKTKTDDDCCGLR